MCLFVLAFLSALSLYPLVLVMIRKTRLVRDSEKGEAEAFEVGLGFKT